MDIWRLITNDHANITDLGRAILRSIGTGAVRSRDRLFDDLDGQLRRHFEAEEDSLYEALEDHERTRRLISELEDEHEEIERQLASLGRVRNKNTREWTDRFEDFTYLLDRHFHREEHELFPLAREILSADELQEVRQEFVEEKLEELREQHGTWGISSGVLWGALAGAAAGALAFAAWRRGYLRALTTSGLDRRLLSTYAGVGRRSRNDQAQRGGKTPLQRNMEKALQMKQQAGPQTNIPEHQTAHEGGVQGSQVNYSDTAVGKEPTYTPNLKRSHVARSGDA
jgi:hemerythrin-like domain-containing protein